MPNARSKSWHLVGCSIFPDFVANEIQPGSTTAQFSGVSGPCSSRANDEVYVLGGSNDGVAVPVADIGNRLSGSFCVGLLVHTDSANVVPVVTFYSSSFEAIGEITVTSNTISFSIGENSAVFTVGNTLGFKRYQLCADGSTMTLYDDCLAVLYVGPQSFASDGLTDGEMIGLVRDLTDNTADRFLVKLRPTVCTSVNNYFNYSINYGFLSSEQCWAIVLPQL